MKFYIEYFLKSKFENKTILEINNTKIKKEINIWYYV